MTSGRRAKYLWLQGFAFRVRNEARDRLDMTGHEAVLATWERGYMQVVTHNLYRVEVHDILEEDFWKFCVPDFHMTPLSAAKSLRNAYRTMMVQVPPSAALLEDIIADPPDLELLMTVKKQPKSKQAEAAQQRAVACTDASRRTCIQIARDQERGLVKFIPMAGQEGFDLEELPIKEFDQRFKPMTDYPVEKAAQLYSEYARNLGASLEAMRSLALIVHITEKDIQMATAKKTATAAKTAATKTPAAKKAPAVKTPAAKKAPAKSGEDKTPATKKADAQPRESAAQLFQTLILEADKSGKTCAHTDDQIFAKVKDKFGLDDKKRSYVAWYRNYLTKQGKNPPAAKAAE